VTPSGAETKSSRLEAATRLVLLALALALATFGYRDHFVPDLPWWRWLGAVLVACALACGALHDRSRSPESRLRRRLRWAAGAAGLLAAALFLRLQPLQGGEVAAAIAASVALAGFVLARWTPFSPTDVRNLLGDPAEEVSASGARLIALRVALGLAAVTAGAVAAYVKHSHHLGAFVLWLTSLALLIAAAWQRGSSRSCSPQWREEAGPELSERAALLGLLLVLCLAAALRMIALEDVPGLIDPDEGRQGRTAELLWRHGFPDAFGLGWNVFPNLAYMTEYVWVQLLGTSNANLRLSAATIGVLSLVPAFFWARRWWGNVVALLAVLLLAINRDHIHWSRVGLNNIQQVLVAGLMLAAFARVLCSRRSIDWVWLGLATGLAFHTYHAAKLFPALLGVAAVLFAAGMRGFLALQLRGAWLGLLAFILCLGPLMVTMVEGREAFYGGTSNRFDLFLLSEAYQRGDVVQVRDYIYRHVVGCLLSFISVPHEGPTLDPFVAVPFLVGAGWTLWRWRDPRHLVLLIWTIGILVIGGMITDYPPWKARLIGFLPAVCVIPAVLAGRVRGLMFRYAPSRADLVTAPLLVIWSIPALHANWRNLFIDLAPLQRADVMTSICRALVTAPLPATIYMAGGAVMAEPKVAANDCMIADNPERVVVNLADDPSIVPIPPRHRGHAVLLVGWQQAELLPLIQHYYPEARHEVVYAGSGQPVLHVLTLRGDAIERSRGLHATFRSSGRAWSLPHAVAEFRAPPDATEGEFPIAAIWRGQVLFPVPGRYGFRASGGSVSVGGRTITAETGREWPAGWHTIELQAQLRSAGERVVLEWERPDSPAWTPVARERLHAHPESHGLLGRYFAREIHHDGAVPIAEPSDYTRIDSALSFDYYTTFDEKPPEPFAARPSTMEWIGTVELREGSAHGLRLEASTPGQVFVNGTLVASAPGGRDAAPVMAELAGMSGRVTILIRSVRPADDDWEFWKLRLLWRRPSGGWTAFAEYRPVERRAVIHPPFRPIAD
jgi:4-amino-4-deoxy-L-arabinose transferase-like glycosyltransferase